jgi:hypothetical protein
MARFSTSSIIADLITWYADRVDWKRELDEKVEKYAVLVDGEEIIFSSVNGQQFRWADTALQPSDWFSIYLAVRKGVAEIKAGNSSSSNCGRTVNFSSLNV